MNEADENLESAVILAAQIVARYGKTYLPIFERLENDLNAAHANSERLNRALEIARTSPH
ncbi:MAG: hypothetical protein KDC43_12500 [Saprospiraceae bacterium]|nr:hypothetical protein [Saprospiraceae bacterium]MCP5299037.1 hypothetical protein [Chromatiaceae bacterium]